MSENEAESTESNDNNVENDKKNNEDVEYLDHSIDSGKFEEPLDPTSPRESIEQENFNQELSKENSENNSEDSIDINQIGNNEVDKEVCNDEQDSIGSNDNESKVSSIEEFLGDSSLVSDGAYDGKVPDNLIVTEFSEGPLGVTLRRRVQDGLVYIHDIIPDSQAESIDVKPNDELWMVGDIELFGESVEKSKWNELIKYIKTCPRPLKMVWNRKEIQGAAIQASYSKEYQQLNELLSTLTLREKDLKYDSLQILKNFETDSMNQNLVMRLLKEDRKVVKSGVLQLQTTGPLWIKSQSKRRIDLLSDILIVSIPQPESKKDMVEFIIDLRFCKVKSLGQKFGGERSPPAYGSLDKDSLLFSIIWPGGSLDLYAENWEVKEVWVLNLYLSICDLVDEGSKGLGWRHQYMIGTMHSAVLHRDLPRIKELIALCEDGYLDFSSIESADEDGYTPLHYACIMRIHNVVKLLHEATADVTIPDFHGFTPLHWSALQLDSYSLGLLCTHVFDLDLLDLKNRTPLYLACIEGRDISGKMVQEELSRCLQVMLEHKPKVNWSDNQGNSLVHYLAASWNDGPLKLLLDAGASVHSVRRSDGSSALHIVAKGNPLRKSLGEGFRIVNMKSETEGFDEVENPDSNKGASTFRVLLKHGGKPNAKDFKGRTALQVLLEEGRNNHWNTKESISEAISVLLSYGARIEDNGLSNSLKSQFPELNLGAYIEKWNSFPTFDGDKLGIKFNHFEVLDIMNSSNFETGGMVEVDGLMEATANDTKLEKDGSASSKSSGKKNPDCQLCGLVFTMFKRQHHCRICNLACCDDCSKKRIKLEAMSVRICDSCYNRVYSLQEEAIKQERLQEHEASRKAPSRNNDRLSSSLEKNKMDLFKGAVISKKEVTNKDTGGSEASRSKTLGVSDMTSTISSTMNETYSQLMERGDKLSKLSDKTEEMSHQAGEFARLAKQLNEQQKSRWF